MNKLKIYDIDSVLANFCKGIIERANEIGMGHTFPKTPQEITKWDMCDTFYDVFKTTFNDKEFWINLEVMPNTDLDFEVDYYLTARVIPNSWTEEWIEKVKLPKATVITVSQKEDKLEILKKLNPLFFVDDNFETVEEAIQNGINAFLFDSPYHCEIEEERLNKVPRIKTLGELKGICQ